MSTPLAVAVTDYLALRRALGYRLIAVERLLDDFADYLDHRGITTITAEAALSWASSPPGATRTQIGRRLSTLRRFAVYMTAFDPDTELPPDRLFPTMDIRRTPYIFSAAEVSALMGAAGRLRSPLWSATITTLIGLMAATGLRTSEAWRLDRDDVDLAGGLLLVRCSKYGRTRQIPLHDSTLGAIADYSRCRDLLCPHPASDALLVSATGRRLGGPAPATTLRRLLTEVDISVPPGRRNPRFHDLRHSFAVATLRDWHQAGEQVQPRLAVLSAYLGHVNPAYTYWYLQAVPELMAVIADRVEASTGVPR